MAEEEKGYNPSPSPLPKGERDEIRIPSPQRGEGRKKGIPSSQREEGRKKGIPSSQREEGRKRGIPSPQGGEGKGEGAKLSVVVLTHNSESDIKACLESAAWADEIVVVDSGSTDATPDIAQRFTDKVYRRDWPGFAQQWNFAIDKASHKWIFVLASDERISEQLRQSIINTISSESRFNGYSVPRKTFFLNRWIKHSGWYPDYCIRLIRKGTGRFVNKLIHEYIEVDGEVGSLDGELLHYSYKTLEQYLERLNKYTSLEAQQMLQSESSVSVSKIRRKMITEPLRIFYKIYVRQKGYKDGIHGLILSVLSSFYRFITYSKYLERKGFLI